MLVLMLLRDAWFFLSHLAFHEVRWLYKHVHKLHHRMTESTALGAYYVTYWDHFLYEQIATFLLSTFLIPGDVLIIYMYLGVFETLAQHSGTHLDDLRLPLVPMFTVGHARSLMGFFVGNLIGNGMETEHHDWHHEKGWTQNYGFSFTFLDKLFGTFHGGRRPWREGESPFRDAERKLN
jgi:sterol desaturase/sphingolipid hydroxylase (fatty acid hydroxylase superfamily)